MTYGYYHFVCRGQAGHRHYGQRDMSMMYPQRRPRPENLDLPNANIPPPMIGGPAYHHQFPPGDPRAMANGYSVGHPNAHMPRHSHQMMYGPGRPVRFLYSNCVRACVTAPVQYGV